MSKKFNNFNAGIIGLGQIGFNIKFDKTRSRIWAHSEAFAKHKEINFKAGADVSEVAREKFIKEYPSLNVYSDYEEMLQKSDINILSLCVHESICAEILENILKKYPKVRYIFCEKPVSDDLKKIDLLIKLAEKNDVYISVNYFRRWQEPFKILKKMIDENHYGKIQSLTAYGCTALKTSSSHLLDILISLSPQITSVYSFRQDSFERLVNNIPDPGYNVIMKCQDDAAIFFKSTSKSPKHFMFEVDIIFDDARVTWTDGVKKIKVYKFTEKNNYAGEGYLTPSNKSCDIKFKETEIMLHAISELIECSKKNNNLSSSLINARNTLHVIKVIEQSSKKALVININEGDLYEE